KGGRVSAVVGRDMNTNAETRVTGKFFADTTGHAAVGALVGADYEMAEQGHMGMSNMWRWSETAKPQAFPQTPWALPLTMEDFPRSEERRVGKERICGWVRE